MWILQFFKEALNSTFDALLNKVKGRFLSFAIQLVVSYLAVAVFTLLITMVIISMLNQGSFSVDIFSFDGSFMWVRLIDPVWIVSIVIAVNFFFKVDPQKKSMSFPDFYKPKSQGFWLDLLIALSVLSVLLAIYHKNELVFYFAADPTPIETLLADGMENRYGLLGELFSNWVIYIAQALPVVTIVVIEVRERKRQNHQLRFPIWKILLATIALSWIVSWTINSFLHIFDQLVMNLIRAPFEMIEIPIVLGVIIALLFKAAEFLVLALVIHHSIRFGMKEDSSPITEIEPNNDILEQ